MSFPLSRLWPVAAVVVLGVLSSQQAFALVEYTAFADARLSEEVEQDANFGSAPLSASIAGRAAVAHAQAGVTFVDADAVAVVPEEPDLNQSSGQASATFIDLLHVTQFGRPFIISEGLILGQAMYSVTVEGELSANTADVSWGLLTTDGFSDTGGSKSSNGSGEELIALQNVTTSTIWLSLSASAGSVAGAGVEGDGGHTGARVTVNHLSYHVENAQGGQPVFVSDARIVGDSGHVYQRGSIFSMYLENVRFIEGLFNWTTSGPGSATTTTVDDDPAAELRAGSEVVLSQLISTPALPIEFGYDVAFPLNSSMTNEGVLSVFMDSILIDTIQASTIGAVGFNRRRLVVDDPSLLGRSDVNLAFHWDGPTGERVWLDNIYVNAVPEPAGWALALLAGLLARARRRR